jgi:adenylate cyclase
VARTVVDSILKDPTKLTLGGEKKELSILFSDIRGFTTFSESLDPQELSQFLNLYFNKMTDEIFKAKGTLDKFIGDAVMAFFGAPLPNENTFQISIQHIFWCCIVYTTFLIDAFSGAGASVHPGKAQSRFF